MKRSADADDTKFYRCITAEALIIERSFGLTAINSMDITGFTAEKKENGTLVSFSFNEEAVEKLLDGLDDDITGGGGVVPDEIEIEYEDFRLEALIIADGYITKENISVKSSIISEGVSYTAELSSSIDYSDYGRVTSITAPEGLSDYLPDEGSSYEEPEPENPLFIEYLLAFNKAEQEGYIAHSEIDIHTDACVTSLDFDTSELYNVKYKSDTETTKEMQLAVSDKGELLGYYTHESSDVDVTESDNEEYMPVGKAEPTVRSEYYFGGKYYHNYDGFKYYEHISAEEFNHSVVESPRMIDFYEKSIEGISVSENGSDRIISITLDDDDVIFWFIMENTDVYAYEDDDMACESFKYEIVIDADGKLVSETLELKASVSSEDMMTDTVELSAVRTYEKIGNVSSVTVPEGLDSYEAYEDIF